MTFTKIVEKFHRFPRSRTEEGSVLIITMIAMMLLVALSGGFVILTTSHTKSVIVDKDNERAYGLLQAAISESIAELNTRTNLEADDTPDTMESRDTPSTDGEVAWKSFGRGNYQVLRNWVQQGRYQLLAQSRVGLGQRFAVVVTQPNVEKEEVVQTIPGKPFTHALFQGGLSGPNAFNWGGTGSKKDEVHGWPPAAANTERIYPWTPPPTTTGTAWNNWVAAWNSNYPSFPAPSAPGTTATATWQAAWDDWKAGNNIPSSPYGGNMYVGDNFHLTQDAIVPENVDLRSSGTLTVTSSGVPESANQIDVHSNPDDAALENPERPNYAEIADIIYIRPEDFQARITYNTESGWTNPQGTRGYVYSAGQPHNTAFSNTANEATYLHKNAPEHIFRMDVVGVDPEITVNTTERHDFFLEDMWADTDGYGYKGDGGTNLEPMYDQDQGYEITLVPEGNNKAYYIDGNMWLHNNSAYSFRLMTSTEEQDDADGDDDDGNDVDGSQITLVTVGNIYISDNFLYQDALKDAIAFVALKDPRDYPDEYGIEEGSETSEMSGNIQFGDPSFGTTYRFCGYMYAENEFTAENVSNNLYVYGNMTAGNRVVISRGVGQQRKSLVIDYDARIEKGLIDLKGIPQDPSTQGGTIEYTVTELHETTFKVRGFNEISKYMAMELLVSWGHTEQEAKDLLHWTTD